MVLGIKEYIPPSIARDFSGQPLQTVAPIDQVQVAHANKGPFIALFTPPLTAGNADESIIKSLRLFEDPVG